MAGLGRSAAVIAYLLLAALALGAGLVALGAPSPVAGIDLFGPLSVLVGVGAPLAGAAFHLRHRDAWAEHRPIALGLGFFALGAIIYPVSASLLLYGWLAAALGGSSLLDWSVGLRVANDLCAIAGTGLLWLGVRRERRRPDARGGRAIRVAIWLMIGLLTAGSFGSGLAAMGSGSTAVQVIGLESLVAGVVRGLLGGGLTVALVIGARAGEHPSQAWWLLGGTRVALLAGTMLGPVLAGLLEAVAPGPAAYILLGEVLNAIGSVGLLVAIALGWPTDHRDPAPSSPA
jgi:hypothetical protein